MQIKLSDYIMGFIAEQGVKHIFMLPGGGAMHLVDSVGRCKGLTYVPMLHEQACSIAAENYARITNNLGVALVTSGPGGTNAVTGVVGAYQESIPILVLSGQVKRADLKKDSGVRTLGLQEVDIVSMVKDITKYAVIVEEPKEIRYHLEKAYYFAKHGRPGPVWLDIPLDVQAALVETEELAGFTPPVETEGYPEGSTMEQYINKVIDLLNNADRPVLLVGEGVHRSGAAKEFVAFVEKLGIPTLTTWLAMELIPHDHPLNFGKPGTLAPRGSNFIIQNTDCLLVVGARMDASVTGFDQSEFARKAKRIMVDIDSAEIKKMKSIIDLGICADAKHFLKRLSLAAGRLSNQKRWNCWIDRCRDLSSQYPVVTEEFRNVQDGVNTFYFGEVLSEELSIGDVVVLDGSSSAVVPIFLTFKIKPEQRFFCTGGIGAMGYGLPGSIGACFAHERQRTICLNGDGGFHLNIQELATVFGNKLPIKFFVFNNQGYGSIRDMQTNHFKGNFVACDVDSKLYLPDLRRIAGAYGIKTNTISGHDQMREQIREIISSNEPVLCEIIVDPNQKMQPRVSSRVLEDGSMKSTSLEDLWPFLSREEIDANMSEKW